jgi:hypothetical protein
MKLKDMIFSDGKILAYEFKDENLRMKFLDYSDSELEIIFFGVLSFEKNEEYKFELADSKLHRLENSMILELLDDENICVFRIQFIQAEVNFL